MTARATRKVRVPAGLLLLAALAMPGAVAATCPPPDWSPERLAALKARQWTMDDPVERAALVQALLACLRHPDPVLRDDVAFEALSTWLRGRAIAPQAMLAMGPALLAALDAPDAAGVGPPFAALVLAELARVDRLAPLWTPAEREVMVGAAVRWVTGLRDYRGFEPGVGWRHAVAHGADWLMQLAMNPALDRAALDRLLDAVAAQALAAAGHAYIYGEGERLARPVWMIVRRDLHDDSFWTAWLAGLASRAGAGAAPAPTTPARLAELHNLKALLYPLYVTAQESADTAARQRLQPGLVKAMRQLP